MRRKPSRGPGEDTPYEVGYCRPPKHTQFKPGQSGNRKGRPKGTQNFTTIARHRLAQPVVVREGAKVRKVSTLDASFARLIEQALRGDHRALKLLLDIARSIELPETKRQMSLEQLLPLLSDHEIEVLIRVQEIALGITPQQSCAMPRDRKEDF